MWPFHDSCKFFCISVSFLLFFGACACRQTIIDQTFVLSESFVDADIENGSFIDERMSF